jgi:hypothetical protein
MRLALPVKRAVQHKRDGFDPAMRMPRESEARHQPFSRTSSGGVSD